MRDITVHHRKLNNSAIHCTETTPPPQKKKNPPPSNHRIWQDKQSDVSLSECKVNSSTLLWKHSPCTQLSTCSTLATIITTSPSLSFLTPAHRDKTAHRHTLVSEKGGGGCWNFNFHTLKLMHLSQAHLLKGELGSKCTQRTIFVTNINSECHGRHRAKNTGEKQIFALSWRSCNYFAINSLCQILPKLWHQHPSRC